MSAIGTATIMRQNVALLESLGESLADFGMDLVEDLGDGVPAIDADVAQELHTRLSTVAGDVERLRARYRRKRQLRAAS